MGWREEFIKSYDVLKYKTKDNKFMHYAPAPEAYKRIIAAIKSGDIRGMVTDESTGTVTEPTQGLRKYVEENESWIFTEKQEFTRR